jgi:hypothetical protein
MIRQGFSPAARPIIFAGDEDKAIGIANLAGQLLKRSGCTLRIFLVHSVSIGRLTASASISSTGRPAAALDQEFGGRIPIRSER